MYKLIIFIAFSCCCLAEKTLDTSKWISLTHPLSPETPVYTAVYTPFKIDEEKSVASDQIPGFEGTFLAYKYIEMYEHTGTHIDAPTHFCEDCLPEDKLTWDHLTGPAVVVDFSDKVAKEGRRANITSEDFEEHVEKYGKIPDNSFVLLRSDWSDHFWTGDFISEVGSEENSYPCISTDGVEWLMENVPNVLGLELLPRNRIIIENLASLKEVPARGSFLMIFPMHMKDATGSPARIVAIVDDASWEAKSSTMLITVVLLMSRYLLQ